MNQNLSSMKNLDLRRDRKLRELLAEEHFTPDEQEHMIDWSWVGREFLRGRSRESIVEELVEARDE